MSLMDKPIPHPTVLRLLHGHENWVWTLAGSPDEKFIAGAGVSNDPRIHVWESQTGQVFKVLPSYCGSISNLAFHKDASQLYSVSSDGQLKKWNLETGEAQSIIASSYWLMALAISKQDIIAAGGNEKKIYLLNVNAEHQPITHLLMSNEIRSLAFSHDGNKLAIGMTGGFLQLATWQLGAWAYSEEWKPHSGDIFTLCFSPDDAFLITGSDDGQVLVHTCENIRQAPRQLYHSDSWIRSLLFADPETLMIGSKKLSILTFPNGNLRLPLDGFSHEIDGLVLFGNGRYLATSKNTEGNEATQYDPCIFDFGAPNLGRGASCVWDEMPI